MYSRERLDWSPKTRVFTVLAAHCCAARPESFHAPSWGSLSRHKDRGVVLLALFPFRKGSCWGSLASPPPSWSPLLGMEGRDLSFDLSTSSSTGPG